MERVFKCTGSTMVNRDENAKAKKSKFPFILLQLRKRHSRCQSGSLILVALPGSSHKPRQYSTTSSIICSPCFKAMVLFIYSHAVKSEDWSNNCTFNTILPGALNFTAKMESMVPEAEWQEFLDWLSFTDTVATRGLSLATLIKELSQNITISLQDMPWIRLEEEH